MKKSNTRSANVGGIVFGYVTLETFLSTSLPTRQSNQVSELLAQYSQDILNNPIIVDVTKYAKENPKAKKIKASDFELGNYDALLFKRAQQCKVKTVHHDNFAQGYNHKDVSQLVSTIRNAKSLLVHALASTLSDVSYDQLIEVSGALNSIHRDVGALLRAVAPWGEHTDIAAISFTH